jgi:peptide deformylase
MINPVILESEGKFRVQESCLSLPGILCNIERAEQVTVRWIDYDTKQEQRAVFYGMEAVICQHECDHLDGILIIDRQIISLPKTGRNEPCPECLRNGIKIKFKKCKEHFR